MKYIRKKYLKLARQIERLSLTCSSLSDIDVRNSCTYIKCAQDTRNWRKRKQYIYRTKDREIHSDNGWRHLTMKRMNGWWGAAGIISFLIGHWATKQEEKDASWILTSILPTVCTPNVHDKTIQIQIERATCDDLK